MCGISVFVAQTGGGRGIRTPGTVSRTVVFKTTRFNRSRIPPQDIYRVAGSCPLPRSSQLSARSKRFVIILSLEQIPRNPALYWPVWRIFNIQ